MDLNEVEYLFSDNGSDERVSILVCEGSSTDFGVYVWPCAHIMSQYVWENRHELVGRRILEVGAGCALPGALASKLGAKVILSDAAQSLDSCKRTVVINNLRDVDIIPVTWGGITPEIVAMDSLDIIID